MSTTQATTEKRTRRHHRIRAKVVGTPERPRLAIFRSNTAVYAQLIDDTTGRTLAAADSRGVAGDNVRARARAVGATIAGAAKQAGVTKVVFDRGGFLYTGVVEALADGAREGGLAF